MTERPRRRGFWGFFASDPRTALTLLVVPVVFVVSGPSWPRFWAMLAVLAVGLAAYAWWARGHG